MRFDGIYTPIVTPYNESFAINKEAFAEAVEFLINAGVSGIVLAGTTGEYYAQSPEERLEMMPFCKSLIRGRVPLIIGTGSMRTDESVMYAKAAKEAGADALLVATPPYAYPTGREIALHALAIDRAANLPVMLYNYPGRDERQHGRGYTRPCRTKPQLLCDQGKLGRSKPTAHARSRLPTHPIVLWDG